MTRGPTLRLGAGPGIGRQGPEIGARPTRRALWAALLVGLGISTSSLASTIVVDQGGSGDCTTIGAGISAAASGDTVLVLPGTYTGEGNWEMTFGSREIVVRSAAGAEDTIIDLEGHAGFRITEYEDCFRVVRGFTITHGGGPDDPAVLCDNAWAQIDSCVFVENPIDDSGEAIKITDCTFATVSACRFAGNRRAISAGSAWGGSTLIENCEFVENSNGAVRLSMGGSGANAFVQSCTFERNETAGNGAAIFYSCGMTFVLDCHFSDNRSAQSGGAIYTNAYVATQSGQPKIWNCTFTENDAASRGGAIARVGSSPDIRRCVFTGNTATRGGAVSIDYDHENQFPARIEGCSFVENEAERGGAVFLSDTGSCIKDCVFMRNRAIMWGGGVCWTESPAFNPRVTGCTFVSNASHRGPGIFSDYAPTSVTYCTFFDNRSDDGAVTILRDPSSVRPYIANCVIAFSSSGTPVHCQLSDPEVLHCVLFGNAAGDDPCGDHHDNLVADPLFCDAYDHDFTLCANSPCLPENNPWGVQIGAHGAGCPDCGSPVASVSWGRIKAMYRQR